MTPIRSIGVAILVAGGWLVLTPGQALSQKGRKDLITREEIEASPKRTDFIFDVIRNLRPNFLEAPRGVRRSGIDAAPPRGERDPMTRPRTGAGGSTDAEVAVFVDQAHVGGIDVLKNILAEQVEEVRYFDPSKAEAEFGLTLGGGGAIVIKMHQEKKPSE